MPIAQWKGYNKEDRERFTQVCSLKDERLFGQWQEKRDQIYSWVGKLDSLPMLQFNPILI